MRVKAIAGRIARRKARASYRTAMRISKRHLAKLYATKVGQVTYKTVASKLAKKYRRYRRRY